jgi:hypothetical protein
MVTVEELARLARSHARRSGLAVRGEEPNDLRIYYGEVPGASQCSCRLEGPHPGEARYWWLVFAREGRCGPVLVGMRHFPWTPEGHAEAIAAWLEHGLPPGREPPVARPTRAEEIGMPGDGWLVVTYLGPGRVEVARTGTGARGRDRAYRLADGAGPSR